MKYCPCSYLRADIKELRIPTGNDWKQSEVEFFACWKKCDVPIYSIPVERVLKENFWDLCQEAWHAPIPENYDKSTDSACYRKVCDWTGQDIFGVEVNFSYGCNGRCVFCTHDHTYDKELEDLYYKCLNDVKEQDILISLTTGGEPFFNKKRTFEYLETVFNKTVNIVTNGTLLTEEDVNKIISLKKSNNIEFQMSFSINGATEETISKIENIKVDYSRLSKVVKTLYENGCICCVSCVIVPESISDIPKLKESFERMSPGLSKIIHVMTNLNPAKLEDAQIVTASKEWKDFFGEKEDTMYTVPKEIL